MKKQFRFADYRICWLLTDEEGNHLALYETTLDLLAGIDNHAEAHSVYQFHSGKLTEWLTIDQCREYYGWKSR